MPFCRLSLEDRWVGRLANAEGAAHGLAPDIR